MNTNGSKNQGFPTPITFASSFVMPLIATSPTVAAERIVNVLTGGDWAGKEFALISPNGKELKPQAFVNEDSGSWLFSYSNALLDKILKN